MFQPKKCAGVAGCCCHIFGLNRSITHKWQFLVCTIISQRETNEKLQGLIENNNKLSVESC